MGLLLALITTHLISDFLLQSRKIATTKGSSWLSMLQHIGIIFLAFALVGVLFLPTISEAILFAFFNAVLHAAIDKGLMIVYGLSLLFRFKPEDPMGFLGTWKGDKKYVDDKMFWDTIGVDQYLHIITIILLYGKYIF